MSVVGDVNRMTAPAATRATGAPLLALLFVGSLSVSVYHVSTHDAPLLPPVLGQ
jgi:hypothetical protein